MIQEVFYNGENPSEIHSFFTGKKSKLDRSCNDKKLCYQIPLEGGKFREICISPGETLRKNNDGKITVILANK